MPDQPSAPAILYAAKSTEDKHGSIPTQLADGRAFAAHIGLRVVAEYADEAASAWRGDRGPELAAALDHAAQLGAALIVQHSDRLARGDGKQARHLAELFFAANRLGVSLRSVQDDSTFDSPILAAVMGERNAEDSKRKSAAVKAGMARSKARGVYVGGKAYGLAWGRNEADERIPYFLPDAIPVVQGIYADYLAGIAQLTIARTLNADGVPTARGGKWHQGTIAGILSAPVYAGLIDDGEKLIEGRHEGIIDRATWDRVHALRKSKARTSGAGRPSAGLHIFRKGFLRCGECGGSIVPLTKRNRTPGSFYEIYYCYGRKQDPSSCCMPDLRRVEIDRAVLGYFEEVGLDVEATRAQITEAINRRVVGLRSLLEAAQREHQKTEARVVRVKRDYTEGHITASDWRELRSELESERSAAGEEVSRLEQQLAEARAGSALSNAEAEFVDQLAEIRAAVAGEVTDADGVASVRAALMRLFDGFVLHRGIPELAHVELIGEFWIEPLMSEHVVAAHQGSGGLEIIKEPLIQAADNYAKGLVT